MFSLGSLGEFFIIIVIAVILIKPSKIPELMHDLGKMRQKMRVYFGKIYSIIDSLLQQGEFDEYQKQINNKVISKENKNENK